MAGGNFGGGDGTSLNPYLIEDELDLMSNAIEGKYCKVANDITLSSAFTGIGIVNTSIAVTTRIYGDNHTIRGGRTTPFIALNSQVSVVHLFDLTFEDFDITGEKGLGVVCHSNYTEHCQLTCRNVHVKNSRVTCTSNSSLHAASGFGGSDKSSMYDCSVVNTTVIGTTVNTPAYGFKDKHDGAQKMERCFVKGGLVSGGSAEGFISLISTRSSNTATNYTISNCYTDTTVVSTGTNSGAKACGFTGRVDGTYHGIQNCYSNSVCRIEGSGAIYLFGKVDDAKVVNCYSIAERAYNMSDNPIKVYSFYSDIPANVTNCYQRSDFYVVGV